MTDLLPMITAFASAHPEVVWFVVSAVLGLTLKALAESKNPYAQGVYHAAVALGIDLPKLLAAARMIFQAVTGKAPPPDPPSKGPLYQPPAPRESEEVTLPRGPRGVARIDAVLAGCGALVILVLAQIVFGCAWLRSNGPEVIHVVDEIDHVCPAVALTLPEIGPICVALDQAERILEILRLAARDKAAAHLRIGGRDLTVRADDVGAVLAGVEGPVAAARGAR